MIFRPVVILFLLCSLALCQEQKASPTQAPQAKLVFYRSTGYVGHNLHASIKIDGERAAHKISENHIWTTELPAGQHFLYGDDKRYGRSYTLEAGKTYHFRIGVLYTPGIQAIGFRVLKVSDDVADAEMWGLEAE